MSSRLSHSQGVSGWTLLGKLPIQISIDTFKDSEERIQAIKFNTSEQSKPIWIHIPISTLSYSFTPQYLSVMHDILTLYYIENGNNFGLSVYLTISLLGLNDNQFYI